MAPVMMRISASVLRRCASPSPSSFERRCVSGTKQSASATSEVGSAHTPILRISRPTIRPSKCFSTRKMVSFFSSPARAKTVKKSATGADGDPGLLAVEHIAAVDLLGRGGDAIQVGAGVGLGHAQRADLLALERRLEQALDDVGVAQHVQELGAHQRLHRRRAGQRHRAARDLLERERELGQAQPGAAHDPPGSAGRRSRAPRAGRTAARGKTWASSIAAACGAIASSLKRAKASRIARWSSVRSKFIWRPVPLRSCRSRAWRPRG